MRYLVLKFIVWLFMAVIAGVGWQLAYNATSTKTGEFLVVSIGYIVVVLLGMAVPLSWKLYSPKPKDGDQ